MDDQWLCFKYSRIGDTLSIEIQRFEAGKYGEVTPTYVFLGQGFKTIYFLKKRERKTITPTILVSSVTSNRGIRLSPESR